MAAKQWLVTLVESLLIAWVLLYLASYFNVAFVAEAGGYAGSSGAAAPLATLPGSLLVALLLGWWRKTAHR